MNKNLRIKKKYALTTGTYSAKFTHEEERNMEIIEANVDYKLIGQRIKEARNRAGISQERLGEIIDVATGYISRVERGNAQVNLRRLSQISMALDTPIEEFVSDTTTKSKNYLNKEFQELLSQCTVEKQRLIYNIAKIVAGIKFV